MNTRKGYAWGKGTRARFRGGRTAAGVTLGLASSLALALALAGCEGGGADRGGSKITVDIRPIVAQMGGSPGGTAPQSAGGGPLTPQDAPIAGPGASAATTDVLTLIIGAVAIGFQDTPLGANTAITDALKDSLQQATIDSTQFIALTRLPASNPFVEFDVPPPAATHWQVVVVGTRDTIHYLDQLKDDSSIYYGFNQNAQGTAVFLSAGDVGADPIDVVVRRACTVSAPPQGCAQYKPDRSVAVTAAVEIAGIYLDGSGTAVPLVVPPLDGGYPLFVRAGGLPSGDCSAGNACAASYVAAQLASNLVVPGIATAATVRIETTHQLSNGQSGACTGATTAAGLRTNCGTENYFTQF